MQHLGIPELSNQFRLTSTEADHHCQIWYYLYIVRECVDGFRFWLGLGGLFEVALAFDSHQYPEQHNHDAFP